MIRHIPNEKYDDEPMRLYAILNRSDFNSLSLFSIEKKVKDVVKKWLNDNQLTHKMYGLSDYTYILIIDDVETAMAFKLKWL